MPCFFIYGKCMTRISSYMGNVKLEFFGIKKIENPEK